MLSPSSLPQHTCGRAAPVVKLVPHQSVEHDNSSPEEVELSHSGVNGPIASGSAPMKRPIRWTRYADQQIGNDLCC
jgi:hypothetical protein